MRHVTWSKNRFGYRTQLEGDGKLGLDLNVFLTALCCSCLVITKTLDFFIPYSTVHSPSKAWRVTVALILLKKYSLQKSNLSRIQIFDTPDYWRPKYWWSTVVSMDFLMKILLSKSFLSLCHLFSLNVI